MISAQNRRQGLSITKANNVKVYDSEFSYTQGTSIEIEPDNTRTPRRTSGIQSCRLNNNKKYGINLFKRVSQSR